MSQQKKMLPAKLEVVQLGKCEDQWMVEGGMILCLKCTHKVSSLRKPASEHLLCVPLSGQNDSV